MAPVGHCSHESKNIPRGGGPQVFTSAFSGEYKPLKTEGVITLTHTCFIIVHTNFPIIRYVRESFNSYLKLLLNYFLKAPTLKGRVVDIDLVYKLRYLRLMLIHKTIRKNNYIIGDTDMLMCGNVLTLLPRIPNDQFDLVITSPPYFNQRKYTDKDEEIGLEIHEKDYIDKLLVVFGECIRVTKPTGSIIFNLGDKWDKADLLLIPYRFALAVKEKFGKKIKLINEITWHKTNPTPRQYNRRLVPGKEPFFHFVLTDSYYYNLEELDDKTEEPKKSGSKVGQGYFKQIEESDLTEKEKKAAFKD